jgi:alanine dehydrogenase
MIIGVLKEIKDKELRVGLRPKDVKSLVEQGHTVLVEENAGVGSGFSDVDYIISGAKLFSGPGAPVEIASKVDILVKVKEPVESEYYWLKQMQGKTLFTFLHLSANPNLAKELIDNKIIGVSYDTLEDENGFIPMLKPMSVIAGHSAIELAHKHHNGILGKVFIIGAGVAGTAAIDKALELGASNVCVYEPNDSKIKELEKIYYDHPVDFASCIRHVTKELYRSDTIIGAALIKGQKSPQVISEDMVKNIKQGAFIVDISIDQGGCIFGSKPTSHSNPTYPFEGKTFCCIPNLPGQKPKEATEALTSLSVPHLIGMVTQGTVCYLETSKGLMKGLNTNNGIIVNETIAKELKL